jgi:[acyl-carrier-protein] S-malonyltransferase
MNQQKKTALVVCPGRGTYNKPELGSITNNANSDSIKHFISQVDHVRAQLQRPTLTELDQAPLFKSSLHQHPDNAATLIYGAGVADFMAIDREQFDVVAITGNSMGWYTALACAGCWDIDTGTRLVSNMAELTAKGDGAQFIYPLTDAEWRPNAARIAQVQEQLQQHQGALFMSINYGGYAVLAGTSEACSAAMAALPKVDERFPMLLHGHAGFHTRLMQQAALTAQQNWPASLFKAPHTPLIDGRGQIWSRSVADQQALQRYTLGHQVTQTYDFTQAVTTALKEFAPDHIILLGPGSGLGGAVAQAMIASGWQDLRDKDDFSARQSEPLPYVLSMGMPEQRALVTGR